MIADLPRLIAYYLPQYYPISENNEWWGAGFTEWTNTAKAKPLFPRHYQPHVPADLGFYDLRLPEARAAQADMARTYGIEGFCYYHYWFGSGRQLLERPFAEVLVSGKPDFPFCLCWANDTWSGIWHGAPDRVLVKQEYPGPGDDEQHFESLLPAFLDSRYMRVDGKPIFLVWRPLAFPDSRETVARWQAMVRSAGLDGLHLVGIFRPGSEAPERFGFDASIYNNNPPVRSWGSWRNPAKLIYYRLVRALGIPTVYSFEKAMSFFMPDELSETMYPSVVNGWDNSPRSGANGLVLTGWNPELYRLLLRKAFEMTRSRSRVKNGRLIFLKSWNEWAEGNHLEPDLREGHGYLKVILEELEAERQLVS